MLLIPKLKRELSREAIESRPRTGAFDSPNRKTYPTVLPVNLSMKEIEKMTKFYVQSGKIKKVIFAADANAAALWLINIVMERFYPDQSRADVESDPFVLLEDGLTLLGQEIFVSKSGFDQSYSSDAELNCFETVDLFAEWNELVLAVSKMEKMLMGQSEIKLCELA